MEFYLLEYAACLASSRQTWQLAAEYLAWCPVHGEAALAKLLEQLPVTQSDRLAAQALQARAVHSCCRDSPQQQQCWLTCIPAPAGQDPPGSPSLGMQGLSASSMHAALL